MQLLGIDAHLRYAADDCLATPSIPPAALRGRLGLNTALEAVAVDLPVALLPA
jgi:hypothetical protein